MSPARLRPTLRLALGELVREPVQPVVEPRALGGTRCLHVPLQNRGRRGGGRRPGGERAPGRTPRGVPEVVPEVPPEVPAHSRSCCAAPAGPACRSARSRPWRWACPACWQTPAARRPAARPPAAAGRWGRLSQARGQEGSGSSAPPFPVCPHRCPLGSGTAELPALRPCTLWPPRDPCSVENPRVSAALGASVSPQRGAPEPCAHVVPAQDGPG